MKFLAVDGLGQVSRIGLGTWQFGSKEWGYGDEYAAGTAIDIVQRALELGVTLFDTAEVYSSGKSERILARALGNRRESVVVASKIFPLAPFPPIVLRHQAASADRLQLKTIPLYQVHQANPLVPDSVIMRGMRTLLDAERIGAVGVSNYSVARWRKADTALGQPVVSNQVQFSLAHAGPLKHLVPFAERQNRMIIAYSPLAQGLLGGRYTVDNRPGGVRRFSPLFGVENLRRVQPLLATCPRGRGRPPGQAGAGGARLVAEPCPRWSSSPVRPASSSSSSTSPQPISNSTQDRWPRCRPQRPRSIRCRRFAPCSTRRDTRWAAENLNDGAVVASTSRVSVVTAQCPCRGEATHHDDMEPHMRIARTATLAAAGLALITTLAACGGGVDGSAQAAANNIQDAIKANQSSEGSRVASGPADSATDPSTADVSTSAAPTPSPAKSERPGGTTVSRSPSADATAEQGFGDGVDVTVNLNYQNLGTEDDTPPDADIEIDGETQKGSSTPLASPAAARRRAPS